MADSKVLKMGMEPIVWNTDFDDFLLFMEIVNIIDYRFITTARP